METIEKLKVSLITKDEALNHHRRDYNPREWEKIIQLYSKEECDMYVTEDNNRIYAVYIADGIRFCKELGYSLCLSSAGLQQGLVYDGYISFKKFGNKMSIENTKANRSILAENTKNFKSIFYY
jgi:hypothetical protein